MNEKQPIPLYKKSSFLLGLLLLTFFLKGLVFAAILPLLQGFDEANHFNTSQDHKYPVSVRSVGGSSDYERVRNTLFNTQDFTDGTVGINENQITDGNQPRKSNIFAQNYKGLSPFYRLTIFFDNLLSNQNFLIRLFSLRILSVLLGTLIVYLVFLIGKNAGFSEKYALLIAAIFAFQPMLTNVTSIINYDVMITLAYALFTYAAICVIREGFSWKLFMILLISVYLGVFTKGPGLLLAGLLILLLLYVLLRKYWLSKTKLALVLLAFLLIFGTLMFSFAPYLIRDFRLNKQSHFGSLGKSLSNYLVTTKDNYENYSRTYWGDFGWINAPISDSVLHFIWAVEIVCVIGLIIFLVRRKNPEFLPKKEIVFVFLIIFFALQFGIRFADWAKFSYRGHLIYGTSGRYFVPALFAHLTLLVVGLGAFFKSEKGFQVMLKASFGLMVLLYLYSIFSVIIPRYYL